MNDPNKNILFTAADNALAIDRLNHQRAYFTDRIAAYQRMLAELQAGGPVFYENTPTNGGPIRVELTEPVLKMRIAICTTECLGLTLRIEEAKLALLDDEVKL